MKKIIFSIIFSLGLLLPSIAMPFLSQRMRDLATQGAQSFYSYMPNVSQYMPSTPQWITTLLSRLSDERKYQLYVALAAALGIAGLVGYKKYADYRAAKEKAAEKKAAEEKNEKIKRAAFARYLFNNFPFAFSTIDGGADNISTFIAIVSSGEKGLNVSDENKKLTPPDALFKVYIYPLLEKIILVDDVVDVNNKVTNPDINKKIWDGFVKNSKEHTTKGLSNVQYIKEKYDFNAYLAPLRDYLKLFIENNEPVPPKAQKLLVSLNEALKKEEKENPLGEPQQGIYSRREHSLNLPSDPSQVKEIGTFVPQRELPPVFGEFQPLAPQPPAQNPQVFPNPEPERIKKNIWEGSLHPFRANYPESK